MAGREGEVSVERLDTFVSRAVWGWGKGGVRGRGERGGREGREMYRIIASAVSLTSLLVLQKRRTRDSKGKKR